MTTIQKKTNPERDAQSFVYDSVPRMSSGFRREANKFERRRSSMMTRVSFFTAAEGSTDSESDSEDNFQETVLQRLSQTEKGRQSLKLYSNLHGIDCFDDDRISDPLELEEEEKECVEESIKNTDESGDFVETTVKDEALDLDPDFVSQFKPEEMRCLALVAHNHMKPAMKDFVLANKNVLKKFMLTGTNTTMTMLKDVFGDDPEIIYGPTCTSGPLGGDAELVSLMVMENLGGCIFFTDPMSAHPHQADVECLTRQANVHNVIMCPNPTSAQIMMCAFRTALSVGCAEMMPSFFHTLHSPSVVEYKKRQAQFLKAC